MRHPRKILFLCLGNTCRSPMAEGLARALGRGWLRPASAGLNPGTEVSPEAVAVMAEEGIDISGHRPRLLTSEAARETDLLGTLGVDLPAAMPAGGRRVAWDIPDPFGEGIAGFRATRDLIRGHLVDLLIDLASEPGKR
ncbi:MAG TPA: low molecular weight phosphatase family protein [bacterium]|nr:low molecular weight phosphatase family protein [bacterium]